MAENEVVNENTTEEAPVAEETPAEETPAEETPAEETPAAEENKTEKKESIFTKEVKPIIAWPCFAGTLAIAVVLALIFWLGAA